MTSFSKYISRYTIYNSLSHSSSCSSNINTRNSIEISPMGSEGCNLKILFFPFLAQGHMLPMVDMAKLFAARGVQAVILTTPANAHLIRPTINLANGHGHQSPIQLHLIPFPSAQAGLPEGFENVSSLPSLDLKEKFFAACMMLREPFVHALRRLAPDCVVSDMFFPWTYDAASELGIPRIVFHGVSLFALSVSDSVNRHKPLESLPADAESFFIPEIPHRIQMLRSQMGSNEKSGPALIEVVNQMKETDAKDYGTLANSFHELEPEYARHYKNVVGRRAWLIGPLSLCNNDIVDKFARGAAAATATTTDQHFCLNWLDSQSPSSVVYVCFGSIAQFGDRQLREIALGLEASNHPFIWVVRKGDSGDWIPEGFEDRIQGKGLIMRGWAPQILILNHKAVGGFVTHCGWNSSLEGISAGLPLITWPLFADQFYNERLIVDVLKIGVAIGVKEYAATTDVTVVAATTIAEAVDRVMIDDGDEAKERRTRARELGEAARRAVEKGGSSYNDIGNLIQELMDMRRAVNINLDD